jgi:hypothetical protein
MKFVPLILVDTGEQILVRVEHVVAIEPEVGGSRITSVGGWQTVVKGSPDDVRAELVAFRGGRSRRKSIEDGNDDL